jgi:putative oxidoreductase
MQDSAVMITVRVAMALLFVITGAQKVISPSLMAPLFKSMGLPAQMGILIGAFEIAASLAFAIGFELRWIAWVLAGWCVFTAVIGHRFWRDPIQLPSFFKNVGLAGAFTAFGVLAAAQVAA